ncbi:MAG: hypothetical protein NC223_05880 [Butyrivibrio sp.]|nr:hypothetical protein [Butyrivibrio sp.]
MRRIFFAAAILSAASLCLFGCSKGSSTMSGAGGGEMNTEAETRRFDGSLESLDLSGLESTISFNGLDLSAADRIHVKLAYSAEEYSYWIDDADTVNKVSDMVREIKGKDLFYPQGIYELSVCAEFYDGDSELFYIGIGTEHFESGEKIKNNIEGLPKYMDAYYYSEGNPQELINLLAKPEWLEGR